MLLEDVLLQNQKKRSKKGGRHECQDPVALTEKYYTKKNSQNDCYAVGLGRKHSELELEAREFQAENPQEESKFNKQHVEKASVLSGHQKYIFIPRAVKKEKDNSKH